MSNESNQDYSQEEYDVSPRAARRGKQGRGTLFILILLILGTIAIIVFRYIKSKTTYMGRTVTYLSKNIDSAKCLAAESGYILYNRDGAEGHNANGTVVWKISYNMKNPIASASGSYSCFADYCGQELHISDGEGNNYIINAPEQITEVDISDTGIVAVRTDAGEADHIYVYNKNGDNLLDIKTDVRASGFPVAMALSKSGTKLVTSYIRLGEEKVSWVNFYNFGDVGQNYSDRLVGSESYKEGLVPDLRFVGEDYIAVTESSSCTLYKFKEIPEKITRIDVPSSIDYIASDESHIVLSYKLPNGNTQIKAYNCSGKETSSVQTGMSFNNMLADRGEIILTEGDALVIYRANGKEKIRTALGNNIRLIVPKGIDASYIMISDNETYFVKLKTEAEESHEQTEMKESN